MGRNSNNSTPNGTKKNSKLRYALYILVVLVATAVSLTISLWGENFSQVTSAFANVMDSKGFTYLLLTLGVIFGSYVVDGLIITVFCRLYTRRYKMHQALAASMVCQFYSDVTPGASGGQVMQAYTLKNQGIQISNAASIVVMWSIMYQIALIVFGAVSLGFEWNNVMSLRPFIAIGDWSAEIPMWPLVLIGFGLNLSFILLLFLMSYSHRVHNFILHYVIGFLGKIRLVNDPDKMRESLRVQVENFKIELHRLQSNIPVLILQFLLMTLMIFMRFAVPYFCLLALEGGGEFVFFSWDPEVPSLLGTSFLTAFHQMVTGLIPLPGSAGVSEIFYTLIFQKAYPPELINATQILWRTTTFHLVLLISGIVSAFYRSRGGETIHHANRSTYVTLQLETLYDRKRSSDTMVETSQLSRKEVQGRLNAENPPKRKGKGQIVLPYEENELDKPPDMRETLLKIAQTREQERLAPPEPEPAKTRKKKKKDKDERSDWDKMEI